MSMDDELQPGGPVARAVAALIVGAYALGATATMALQRLVGAPLEQPQDALLWVGFGAFAVVGAVVVAHRPRHRIGWLLATIGLAVAVLPATEAYAAYVMATRGQPDALATFGAWANAWYWFVLLALAFVALPLLFPDGRLPSRRWWPVAAVPAACTLAAAVLGALTETLHGQSLDYVIANPIGVAAMPGLEQHPAFGWIGAGLLLGAVGALAGVVVRFRRSRGVERAQMK